eukprot:CAMPEP_0185264726 /NCGR_PEP_ID=MMETSP1359-20130426/24512_1 /TAXON_ID=552665 /ORGANISM="Bigelowiella longifila, Strain CCMP242" /LENGTH=178 /DNA_ID=CAMNT_0027853499 /DNA_START=300 /DNA_END=836 /DNA_ORIENTATION=-
MRWSKIENRTGINHVRPKTNTHRTPREKSGQEVWNILKRLLNNRALMSAFLSEDELDSLMAGLNNDTTCDALREEVYHSLEMAAAENPLIRLAFSTLQDLDPEQLDMAERMITKSVTTSKKLSTTVYPFFRVLAQAMLIAIIIYAIDYSLKHRVRNFFLNYVPNWPSWLCLPLSRTWH